MNRLLETKMTLLSWMMLVFLLSAGSCSAAVDVNWLTGIVNAIRTEYRIKGQFCLAANIPLTQDPNKLHDVLQEDSYSEKVADTLSEGEVYKGSSVVVAKPDRPEHAEVRVLKNLQPLISKSKNHFLLIYSYLSACGGKCTNPDNNFNILKYIRRLVPNWTDAAFVFTRVFDQPQFGPAPTKEELKQSLIHLGDSGLRLRNIFRCYKPQNLEFQCYSCSSQQRVADVCVENNVVPQETERSRSRSRDNIVSRKRHRMSPSDDSRSSSRSSRSSSRSGSSSGSRSRSMSISSSGSRSSSGSGSSSGRRSSSGSGSSSGRRSRSMSISSSGSRSSSGSGRSSGRRSRSMSISSSGSRSSSGSGSSSGRRSRSMSISRSGRRNRSRRSRSRGSYG